MKLGDIGTIVVTLIPRDRGSHPMVESTSSISAVEITRVGFADVYTEKLLHARTAEALQEALELWKKGASK